jgi:Fe-S cluster assembly iron-binding protein IscA
MTTQAAAAIQQLVAEQPGGGLRILPRDTEGEQVQLGLEVVAAPAPTDEVVEEQGSQLFIDEQLSALLDGKTLDAEPSGDRGVSFSFV